TDVRRVAEGAEQSVVACRAGSDVWAAGPWFPQNPHIVFLAERKITFVVYAHDLANLFAERTTGQVARSGADERSAQFPGDHDHFFEILEVLRAGRRLRRGMVQNAADVGYKQARDGGVVAHGR